MIAARPARRPGRRRRGLHRPDRRLLGGVSRLRHGRGWRGAGAAGARQLLRRRGRHALGGGARRARRRHGRHQADRATAPGRSAACTWRPGERGTGLAQRLLDTAEAHAQAAGAERLVLWTDTRFDRGAPLLREARPMSGRAPSASLDDLSNSLEFRYAKPARGLVVEALDAAAAASAERRLSEILVACVDAGASVSFLPPLAMAVARGFWRKVATDVAPGEPGAAGRLAGWRAGRHGAARARHAAEPAAPRRCDEAAGRPRGPPRAASAAR